MQPAAISSQQGRANKTTGGWLRDALILTNMGFLILICWSMIRFGSLQGALNYAIGGRLGVVAAERSFGIVPSGSVPEVEFQLDNMSYRSVRVLGAEMGCAVTINDEIPFSVGPRERKTVHFKVAPPAAMIGAARFDISLLTNVADQPQVPLIISGTVVEPRTD